MPISNYSSARSSLLEPYTIDQFERDIHRVQGRQLPFFKARVCKGATWKTVMPGGPGPSPGNLSHFSHVQQEG